jgi:two-component system LytT family response regulator
MYPQLLPTPATKRSTSINDLANTEAPAVLSALIVDDEPIARRRVRLLLSRDPQIRIVGECASVGECERLDAAIIPDLLFLDVRMPQQDGFALLEAYNARGIHPFVIFVTAYSMYALNAYESGAVDYLLKPFDDERFAKALGRAKAALNGRRITAEAGAFDARTDPQPKKPAYDRLLVTENGRIFLVPTHDIELIQVAGKHVKVFVRDHCYLTRQSLRSVEERLDNLRFVRVHRTTIINIEQIIELRPLQHGDCEVVLSRGTRVTVSRRYRRRLPMF